MTVGGNSRDSLDDGDVIVGGVGGGNNVMMVVVWSFAVGHFKL